MDSCLQIKAIKFRQLHIIAVRVVLPSCDCNAPEISDADAWSRACWGKKSCLFCHLICAKNAELVRIEVLSRDSMSCLFILCLQLVSLCTGCAHGNYVDACATESYQMKILENGTSHNLVWGKPVTLFHTATDSRRHRHSRHSHHAEFLKPDAMGVMMRSRGRYFKGRFLRDGFQYLCRPNFRARKSRTAWQSWPPILTQLAVC